MRQSYSFFPREFGQGLRRHPRLWTPFRRNQPQSVPYCHRCFQDGRKPSWWQRERWQALFPDFGRLPDLKNVGCRAHYNTTFRDDDAELWRSFEIDSNCPFFRESVPEDQSALRKSLDFSSDYGKTGRSNRICEIRLNFCQSVFETVILIVLEFVFKYRGTATDTRILPIGNADADDDKKACKKS